MIFEGVNEVLLPDAPARVCGQRKTLDVGRIQATSRS